MANVDVTLVFPPLTEARLFPYLSLPMMTAYLRERGYEAIQHDLNIDLCHRLFQVEQLERWATKVRSDPAVASSLRGAYRLAMADYLREHHELLCAGAWDKVDSSEARRQHDVRFVRQGIELLLEGSLLARSCDRIERLPELIEPDPDFDADIATATLHHSVHELLERARPQVFGISVTFFSQLAPALLIARWVRAFAPDITIVLGGQQIMSWSSRLLQQPWLSRWVDALGVSGGEACLVELLRCLRGERPRAGIPDLVWAQCPRDVPPPRSTVHLNELPPPDFSDLPITRYLSEESHLAVITCVGCYWGRCAFCSYGNRSHRQRSYQQVGAEHLADTCEQLVARHGIRRINFVDENTPLKLVMRTVRLLAKRGVEIRFSTRNRLEAVLLDPDFCMELSARGCVLMSIGYETNSQRLLDKLDKGVRADDFQRIIDNLHAAGITLRFSVMGGLLDESEDERAASEAFLRDNADKIGIDIMQMLVMEPGTYLAEDPQRYNLTLRSREQLRGNALLNYGNGRMGYTFDFVDGDSFDSRLSRFVSIFHNVAPQKNDELPPNRRHVEQPSALESSQPIALRLRPWVSVLNSPDHGRDDEPWTLADLLWQRVFRLPGRWTLRDRTLLAPEAADELHTELMRNIIRQGLVEQVYDEMSR